MCLMPLCEKTSFISVGLGDIRINFHDISWQKVLRYYYIYTMIFYFFQPEANYTIECIILVDAFKATLHEVYIQTFKQPFIIISMPCTHANKIQTIILLQ